MRSSGRAWLVFAIFSSMVGACGKKDEGPPNGSAASSSAAACEEPIDWFINRTVDSLQRQMAAQGTPVPREKAVGVQAELKKLLLRRCTEDGWAKPVLDCVHAATKQNDIHACKKAMTAEQRQRFQNEAAKLLPLVVSASVMPGPNQSIGIAVRNLALPSQVRGISRVEAGHRRIRRAVDKLAS